MKIVLYSTTETRPFVYTLLKMLQPLGDVGLFTENLHYRRLLEDGSESGSFENIFVVSNGESPLDIFDELGLSTDEFEFMIFDNKIVEDYDLFIHVVGCREMDYERDTLEFIEEESIITINFGYGNKGLPYTIEMFKRCEETEAHRMLVEIDPKITKRLCDIMQPYLNISSNELRKVVAKKR